MPLAQEEYADKEDSELLRRIKSSDWKNVKSVVETKDGEAMIREPDVYGNLPLHAAIGYKAPDEIILELLKLYPEATRAHGTDYWLPLHVAAMWGSSAVVMEAIIRCYPEALDDAGEPGIKGRTPRHFKARFKHNTELLERSTEEWQRIIEKDEDES